VTQSPQDVASILATLTETQRSRLTAHLSGESGKAIARRENVSPQAVAQTLSSQAGARAIPARCRS
jgi:hypothetical protein